MAKVLVTGADGFIGSHLAESLVAAGYEVRALCQYNSFSSCGWLDDSPAARDMDIVLGDIRDAAQMKALARGMDIIFHLAALIAIPYSYQAPASYVETNISGTLNILQAGLEAGVKKMIHTSTSEVYGTAQSVPISENHPLQAQSPYSASKIGADALAYSFYSSFNLPVTIARPFNTYGPRQSARAVIPTVITQLLSGAKKIKLGALTPTRDFNFVLDSCAGFLALATCDEAIGKTVNIGAGTEISIGDTVKTIANIMGVEVEIEQDKERLRPETSEVERLLCDNTLMRKLTGFKHTYTLEQGLAETIAWFKKPENLKRYKADTYHV